MTYQTKSNSIKAESRPLTVHISGLFSAEINEVKQNEKPSNQKSV